MCCCVLLSRVELTTSIKVGATRVNPETGMQENRDAEYEYDLKCPVYVQFEIGEVNWGILRL